MYKNLNLCMKIPINAINLLIHKVFDLHPKQYSKPSSKPDFKLADAQNNKHDIEEQKNSDALTGSQWNKAWLDVNDIQQMILKIASQTQKLFTAIQDGDRKNGDGQIIITSSDQPPIPLFVIAENEDMHQFCRLNSPAIAIVCKNQNHWVAVKKELISGKDSTNPLSYNYHFADSLQQTNNSAITQALDEQTLFSSILEDTIHGKVLKQLDFAELDGKTKDFVSKNISDWRSDKFPKQDDGYNCGIHSFLNGLDMVLNYTDNDVCFCTASNVTKYRKMFCDMKVEEAKQSEKEKFYTEYTVGDKVWKVTAPSPLSKNDNSPLMELLTIKSLVEQDSKQKQFLFKENNSDETAYIDTKHHHSAVANGDYTLQTTIEKHTETIANALLNAYNEVYTADTANFYKIHTIWQKAQNEKEWNALREKDDKTDEDRQMLEFSTKFQATMHAAGLMTGNPNATKFVGMRLKRVSSCHMEKLRKNLSVNSGLKSPSSNRQRYNRPQSVQSQQPPSRNSKTITSDKHSREGSLRHLSVSDLTTRLHADKSAERKIVKIDFDDLVSSGISQFGKGSRAGSARTIASNKSNPSLKSVNQSSNDKPSLIPE